MVGLILCKQTRLTIATDRIQLGDRCATVVAKWSRSPKGTYHYSAVENFFQKIHSRGKLSKHYTSRVLHIYYRVLWLFRHFRYRQNHILRALVSCNKHRIINWQVCNSVFINLYLALVAKNHSFLH